MTEDWLASVDWGKYHRDHVLHQPLCGYIMLKLLDGDGITPPLTMPNGKSILESCVETLLQWNGTAYIRDFLLRSGMNRDDILLQPRSSVARAIWSLVIREAAHIAAVFHDLGYPWQYALRLSSNLRALNTPSLAHNEDVPSLMNLFENRLLFRSLNGYVTAPGTTPSTWRDALTETVETSISKTHGFPGALGFLHLNDFIRQFPMPDEIPLKLLCVEWAAMAIMMHDMSKVYWGQGIDASGVPQRSFLRLSFEKDPVSALVTLVDLLQDFERPTVRFGTPPEPSLADVTLKYDSACEYSEIELTPTRALNIKYRMRGDSELATKRLFLVKEQREYFDVRHGYLDLEGLGIEDVHMSAI